MPPIVVKAYGGVEATPVNLAEWGAVIGVYGPGGAGKTTFVGTAVESEFGSPMYYIDARGHPEVLRHHGDKIHVAPFTTLDKLEKMRQDILKDGEFPFKTIVLDNVSEMWSRDLKNRYGPAAEVKWEMHSASTAGILSVVRNWSDLADLPGRKINIIFVMWETPEKRKIRGLEVDRSELSFNKALQSQIPGIITWLGRLYIVDGPPNYTRCLDFRPIESQQVSKFQIDRSDPRTSAIPMEIYRPHLGHILDTVRGGKPWPTAEHAGLRAAAGTTAPNA